MLLQDMQQGEAVGELEKVPSSPSVCVQHQPTSSGHAQSGQRLLQVGPGLAVEDPTVSRSCFV